MKTIPDEFIDATWAAMAKNPHNTFLILTKRPRRMLESVSRLILKYGILYNVWLGCTVVNQQEADEKIPIFLQVPGRKFLSIEPCLGEINLSELPVPGERNFTFNCLLKHDDDHFYNNHPTIDAVILGGETLGNRPGRTLKIEVVESIVDQCEAAGVSIFVKQIHINNRVSKNMAEWPENIRRRQLPWLKKDR